MISYLYIKNFKNIKEIEIYPSQRINLIQGGNGQGKSSLLQAIKYIFTNELDEKISEYVRWGCDKFIIKCNFIIDHTEYKYIIEASETAKKELIVGEDVYKNSEATKKLSEILNPIILKYSAISEQHKTAQILFDSPTENLKKLKHILGIDALSVLVDELKDELKDKKYKIEESKKEIDNIQNREYHYIDVPVIETDIDRLNVKKEKLELQKEIYDKGILLYTDYLKRNDEYEKMQSSLKTYEELLSDLIGRKNCIDQNQEYESKDSLNTQIDNNNYKLMELEKSKINNENIKKEYDRIQSDIIKVEKDIELNEDKLKTFILRRLGQCNITQDSLDKLITEISNLGSEITTKTKSLELANQGKCPTCGQDYIVDSIEELTNEIDKLKIQKSHWEEEYKNDKETLQSYTKQKEEQSIIQVQRNNIDELIKNKKTDLIELTKLLNEIVIEEKDFDSEIKLLTEDIQDLKQRVKKVEQQEKDSVELNHKIDNLNEKIYECKNIECPVEIKKPEDFNNDEYLFILKEINIYEQKIQERDKALEHNNKIKLQEESDKELLSKLEKDIDSYEFEIGVLKETIQVLDKEFPSFLIDKGAQVIKEYMNDFFERAYGRYEITFEQTKNSISFFYGDGNSVASCGVAGGLEKAVLAIALRIALLKLQDIDFLTLDEIDSDASVENSQALYETIISYCQDMQIFSVTHLDETKEYLLQQIGSNNYEFKDGQLI